MKRKNIGLAFGRFQPFHNGHINYIFQAFKHVDYLLIGISNPDPATKKYDHLSPHRSLLSSNPFTFFERFEMIKNSLDSFCIDKEKFDIIPLPVNNPMLIPYYVPRGTLVLLAIHEEWDMKKKRIFQRLGYNVRVIIDKPKNKKITTGQEIREKMLKNKPWSYLVPTPVCKLVDNDELNKRLKHFFSLQEPQ